MDDINTGRKTDAPDLKSVIRKATVEMAEQSDVISDLREAEQARLEILAEALEPVLAQVPESVDMFDTGVMPGDRPRLFVDVIGFVEMADDKRTYCFFQDTRYGRVKAGESTRVDKMVDILTNYIARRLMERERALESDRSIEQAALALALLGKDGPLGWAARNSAASEPREAAGLAEYPEVGVAQSGSQAPAAKLAEAQEDHSGTDSRKRPSDAQHKKNTREGLRNISEMPNLPTTKHSKPQRKIMTALWDGVEFVALFIGFVVLIIGLAGALYFAWTMGEGFWVSRFLKTG